MNCYFVSCEIAQHPELKGKSVVVGYSENDRKGIVLTASYEARKYGIRAAMPICEALRRCQNLIIVQPNMDLYVEYSRKFFDYLSSITSIIEPASIDEAYLDVTDVCSPSLIIDLAHDIQNDIMELFQLPCSIGIAPNKFLAKMASDMKKPMGITILRKREIDKLLWPLPISDMYGVGKRSLDNFKALGIKTIGDLANYKDLELLKSVLGRSSADSLYLHANGEGSNEVDATKYNEISSISNSQTLSHDEYDTNRMLKYIKILVNSVANRLEKANIKAYTFTLQIKYFDFRQTSKSKTFTEATNDNHKIFKIMQDLFEDLYENDIPVRLFGVAASKFTEAKQTTIQYSLFDELDKVEKEQHVLSILEDINKTIGSKIINLGMKNNVNNKMVHNPSFRKEINEEVEKIE